MSGADPRCVARIEVRPQRIRVVEWLLLAEVAGILGYAAYAFLRLRERGIDLPSHLWWMTLVMTFSVGPPIWRVARRRRAPTTIEVGPEFALLPRLWAPREMRRVPLDEIRSIYQGTGRSRAIGIGVSSGTAIAIRDVEFADPSGAAQLEAALRAAIAARPDGATQLAAIDRRTQFSRLVAASVPWTCSALSLAAFAVFAVEFQLGGWNPVNTPNLMVRLGANVAPLIQAGEWWRLVSANALHANLLHISMNALGFAICGLLFERWIGWSKTLLIALAGGFGGTLASALVTQPSISVGASTMVMGLFVGWIAATARCRERLPHRTPVWAFLLMAVSLLVGEFALPNIDHAGHVGGAAAGAVTALLLTRDPDPLSLRWPSRGARIAVALLAAVYVLGIAQAIRYAWSWSDARRIEADRVLLGSPVEPDANNAAWDIATLAAAPPSLLAEADARMQEVVAPAGMEGVFADTRATLAWRRGDLPRAVELGSEALRRTENRFQASQLARFEWAQLRATGNALRIGAGPESVSFRLEAARPDEPGPTAVVVEIGKRPAQAATIDALAVRRDTPIAHLRLAIGPDVEAPMRLATEDAVFAHWTEGDVHFVTTLVDGENGDETEDVWRWRLWNLDPGVAALP